MKLVKKSKGEERERKRERERERERFEMFSSRCAGVNYNRRVGQCEVFDAIDGDSEVNEHVDFYKNLCVIKDVSEGFQN